MLQRDLEVEYEVRGNLASGIALCERHGDYVTRDILLAQLKDTEEDHAHWLEQQLGLIHAAGHRELPDRQDRRGFLGRVNPERRAIGARRDPRPQSARRCIR